MGTDHPTKIKNRSYSAFQLNGRKIKTTLGIHCGVQLTLRARASTVKIPLQILHKFVKQKFITAAGSLFRPKK